MYVYGLQQYGQLNKICPLRVLFCSVMYFKTKKVKIYVSAVFNLGS